MSVHIYPCLNSRDHPDISRLILEVLNADQCLISTSWKSNSNIAMRIEQLGLGYMIAYDSWLANLTMIFLFIVGFDLSIRYLLFRACENRGIIVWNDWEHVSACARIWIEDVNGDPPKTVSSTQIIYWTLIISLMNHTYWLSINTFTNIDQPSTFIYFQPYEPPKKCPNSRGFP